MEEKKKAEEEAKKAEEAKGEEAEAEEAPGMMLTMQEMLYIIEWILGNNTYRHYL